MGSTALMGHYGPLKRAGLGRRPGHFFLRVLILRFYGGGDRAAPHCHFEKGKSGISPRWGLGSIGPWSGPGAREGRMPAAVDRHGWQQVG